MEAYCVLFAFSLMVASLCCIDAKHSLPEEKHWMEYGHDLPRMKRTDETSDALSRMKRLDKEVLALPRVKRLDDTVSLDERLVLSRMKRLDRDPLALSRTKRLDDDVPSLSRVKRLNKEVIRFEGKPTSLLRMKRLDAEPVALSRTKRLDHEMPSSPTKRLDDTKDETSRLSKEKSLSKKSKLLGRRREYLDQMGLTRSKDMKDKQNYLEHVKDIYGPDKEFARNIRHKRDDDDSLE